MGRPLCMAPGEFVYHVLNRANGRLPLFEDDDDYAAFERVLADAELAAIRQSVTKGNRSAAVDG